MRRFEIGSTIPQEVRFYTLLAARLESELILHSGHGEKHLGITNNLSHLLTYMHAHEYILRGIHESCLSGQIVRPDRQSNRVTISCLLYAKTPDTGFHHVGYVSHDKLSLEVVKETITTYYSCWFATCIDWTEKKGKAYFIRI